MSYLMKIKIHSMSIIIIIFFVSFVSSRIQELLLNEINISKTFAESTYFHVKRKFDLSNYIKISIDGKDKIKNI